MDESNQKQNFMLGLSGEFLVAGELLRREIGAAVTYGNAKKPDVIAVDGENDLPIEVRTTREPKWVVGGKVPEPNGSIWVLVYLPRGDLPAEFFILKSLELHVILKPIEDAWLRKCQETHGQPMPGVYSVRREEIESHKDAWQKIRSGLAQAG